MKVNVRPLPLPMRGRRASLLMLVGVAALVAACSGGGSVPAGNSTGGSAPGNSTGGSAPGNGAADTSTSNITNVCSVVTPADLVAAFGGSWDYMTGAAPLTCDFELTGNESSSALAAGSAVEIVLKPNSYAASGMGLAQSIDGLGEQAGVLGNTLFIKRGADVIEILTMPYDASAKAQAAMVALGKAIYSRF